MSDIHPIPENLPVDMPVEEKLRLTRIALAQLWDQVWWIGLPFYKRWYYRLRGFPDPIDKFYEQE